MLAPSNHIHKPSSVFRNPFFEDPEVDCSREFPAASHQYRMNTPVHLRDWNKLYFTLQKIQNNICQGRWDVKECYDLKYLNAASRVSCLVMRNDRVYIGWDHIGNHEIDRWPVSVYYISTQYSVYNLEGHKDEVCCITDDKTQEHSDSKVYTGSMDKTVRIWNKINGKLLKTLKFNGPVFSICVDERRIYSGTTAIAADNSTKTTIEIFNKVTGAHISTLKGIEGKILCMEADAENVYSGSEDKCIRIWSKAGTLLKSLSHDGAIKCLYLNGGFIYSGSLDHTVRVWNKKTYEPIKTIQHPRSIYSITMDDKNIYCGLTDGCIFVWDKQSYEKHPILPGHREPIHMLHMEQGAMFSGSLDGLIIERNFDSEPFPL